MAKEKFNQENSSGCREIVMFHLKASFRGQRKQLNLPIDILKDLPTIKGGLLLMDRQLAAPP